MVISSSIHMLLDFFNSSQGAVEEKKTAVEEVAINQSERSPRQAFFRTASDELVSSYKDEWDNLMFREGRFMQIGQY